MFRKHDEDRSSSTLSPSPIERVSSVLGSGIAWNGNLSGSGGVRIEGSFQGEIKLHGLLVISETGRIECEQIRASAVIIAGAVRGNIIAEKVEIRSTGRVWGDVVTVTFATEEGGFLRGQIRMEDKIELDEISAATSDTQQATPEVPEPNGDAL